MKSVTVTPRCENAGPHRIRCDQPGCDYCADIRDKIRLLSTMSEPELADYCAPHLNDLVNALADVMEGDMRRVHVPADRDLRAEERNPFDAKWRRHGWHR